jgi:hypothetical protein
MYWLYHMDSIAEPSLALDGVPLRSTPQVKAVIRRDKMKRMIVLLVVGALLCSCGTREVPPSPANSILILEPYRYGGTWVFDDPRTGLVREPFVAGIPKIIDHLVRDVPDADKGFRMLFSAQPFPGHMMKVMWRRAERGGNWYYSEELDMEGWLCPALFKYFKEAPKEIYVKAERKTS